jgi:hypothetical protein
MKSKTLPRLSSACTRTRGTDTRPESGPNLAYDALEFDRARRHIERIPFLTAKTPRKWVNSFFACSLRALGVFAVIIGAEPLRPELHCGFSRAQAGLLVGFLYVFR